MSGLKGWVSGYGKRTTGRDGPPPSPFVFETGPPIYGSGFPPKQQPHRPAGLVRHHIRVPAIGHYLQVVAVTRTITNCIDVRSMPSVLQVLCHPVILWSARKRVRVGVKKSNCHAAGWFATSGWSVFTQATIVAGSPESHYHR